MGFLSLSRDRFLQIIVAESFDPHHHMTYSLKPDFIACRDAKMAGVEVGTLQTVSFDTKEEAMAFLIRSNEAARKRGV